MISNVLLLPRLIVQYDHVFEHIPELLTSFLVIAFLLLPQCPRLYRRELVKISEANDDWKTSEYCWVAVEILNNVAPFIYGIHQFRQIDPRLHSLSQKTSLSPNEYPTLWTPPLLMKSWVATVASTHCNSSRKISCSAWDQCSIVSMHCMPS